MRWWFLETLVVLLALACNARSNERAPKDAQRSLSVELGGCAHVTVAGGCELRAQRELTVWSDAPRVEARIDGALLRPLEQKRVGLGTRLKLRVPPGARELVVSAAPRSARVALSSDSYPAALTALRDARARGNLDAAERGLLGLEAKPEAFACQEARITSLRARIAFSRGDVAQVERAYRSSIPQLLACGRASEAAADAFALFYSLSEQQRSFDHAERMLDDIATRLGRDGENRAWLHYYRASLALRRGQLAQALELLTHAEHSAERLDLTLVSVGAWQMRGWIQGVLGRHELAASSIERALSTRANVAPCERATLLTTAGYQRLLAVEAGEGDLSRARELLERAHELEQRECHDRQLRARTEVNLAQAWLFAGNVKSAREVLDRAAQGGAPADVGLAATVLDMRARLLLAEDEARAALDAYDALRVRMRAAGVSVFAAELGRGLALRALVALGDIEGARAAARRSAARVLGSVPRLMPASLPNGGSAQRQAALAEYARLRQEMERDAARSWALPQDQLERAAKEQESRAERARASLDRALEGSSEALPARTLEPGELELVAFPSARGSELFVRDETGLSHRVLTASEVPRVLDLLAERVERARVVTVIGAGLGPLSNLHTFAFRGAMVLEHAPVRYALDLPRAAAQEASALRVFVTDPREDLPASAAEGAWLSQRFAPSSRIVHLRGREATRAALLPRLREADALHFSGHASFTPEAFFQSALLLADDSTFSLSDVLVESRMPREVVLSACDTATARAPGLAVGLGLAQAFVLRGTARVVATTEPVSDRVAHAFARAFYTQEPSAPIEQRLQRALLALRDQGMPWEGYRLLVP